MRCADFIEAYRFQSEPPFLAAAAALADRLGGALGDDGSSVG